MFGGSWGDWRTFDRVLAGAGRCGRGAGREGKEALAFESDKQRRHKSDQQPDTEAPSAGGKAGPRRKRGPNDVGNALRSAYQQAVSEDIPPEMLDLLGKLG
jgi:hypothetical protein